MTRAAAALELLRGKDSQYEHTSVVRGSPQLIVVILGRRMSDDVTPTNICQQGPRQLGITWSDGADSSYDVRALRLACRCAECVDEWTGKGTLDPASVPDDVHPLSIRSVGRYAIQINWSDGHSTGIYPYRRLRALAERPC